MRIYAAPDPNAPLLVLAHGAGAGENHPWLRRVAGALAALGVSVTTFDFPYRQAGRKLPDRGPVLEAAFQAVWQSEVVRRDVPPSRIFAGGKSMGGRIASQVGAQGGLLPAPDGFVFFGYPLHPPGKPSQRRDQHLPDIPAPVLFLHGTRDPFGSPQEMRELVQTLPHATLELIEGGDHSLGGSRIQPGGDDALLGRAIGLAAAWMLTEPAI